jgi:hypothetical protein
MHTNPVKTYPSISSPGKKSQTEQQTTTKKEPEKNRMNI